MKHLDDDDDQDERGPMALAGWLLIGMWALFGLLIAWLCSDGEGIAKWIGVLQAYLCYVWITVALAAVLMLAIGEEQAK